MFVSWVIEELRCNRGGFRWRCPALRQQRPVFASEYDGKALAMFGYTFIIGLADLLRTCKFPFEKTSAAARRPPKTVL